MEITKMSMKFIWDVLNKETKMYVIPLIRIPRRGEIE